MSDLINVLDRKVLGEIVKNVPWIEGASVTFLNDVSGDFTEQLEAKTKELGDKEAGYWSITQTIVDWNFCDDSGKKMEVSVENFKRLSLKLQKWIFAQGSAAMLTDEERKKGLPATS